ncbi:ABC transporter substrate-binding protein [Lachnospiraceae bacterium OttesenSCG-928-D06]|nr:ABC transporter substrate-binding protein [Lachnospiraceae bacterium OttesenSCG-928-D06]
MRKKMVSIILASVVSVCMLAGCGSSNKATETGNQDTSKSTEQAVKEETGETTEETAGEKTKIRVYIGGDNADLNTDLVEAFNAQSTTAEAEIVTLTDGQSGYQMLTVMYNSNSAPNVFFLEANDIEKLQDKLASVSEMDCIQYASMGTLDDVMYNGETLGVPVKTQAYGFIYNKAAVAELLGEDFDVNSVKSLGDFQEVCEMIEEKGAAATVISPYNWSLGNHYFNMVYSGQDDPDAFVDSLRKGNADLIHNEVFNSYMDTFDTMMTYNYYKENPLEDVADEAVKQSQTLYTEEAVFWFQGSWESSVIRQLDTENEYGFIPVPLALESENNYGKICSLVPGYFCVDAACSTDAQQEAAKEFIQFATMSEQGQQYVIDDGNIPAYTNNEKEITESLVKSAYDYISSGETFAMYTDYPSDHYEKVGNIMQQYLDGKLDRSGLASEIETYWSNQE